MPIFQGRRDADRAVSLVRFDSFLSGAAKRHLRLGHRPALCLCGKEVFTTCDRFSHCNLPGLVVYNDLLTLVTLHRVHRELKLPVFDLKLPRDWLALTLTGRETLF